MSDQSFPVITYLKDESPQSWGRIHGESFRSGIKELCSIRKNLLLTKNPKIKNSLKNSLNKQFEITKKYSPEIANELSGIADGAGVSLESIVILNNYTDIRDINLTDEGCSTVHVQNFQKGKEEVFAGQTWDMHSSAKDYCAILNIPKVKENPAMILFTLVGCVGMMGVNDNFLLAGINNINTKKAENGVIWPVTVRQMLNQKTFNQMKDTLLNTPLTSGHNYMLSGNKQAEHWEVTPYRSQMVCHVDAKKDGIIYHTNHCLGEEIKPLEIVENISISSKARYSLLQKKTGNIRTFNDLKLLFKDHENYPHSICLHAKEEGRKDSSATCGGGVAHLTNQTIHFWRGCKKYDSHYREYDFKWDSDNMQFNES